MVCKNCRKDKVYCAVHFLLNFITFAQTKLFMRFIFLPILILCFQISHAQWTSKDFKKLKNLPGRWEMKTSDGYLQEKWEQTNDSTYSGVAYHIQRGVVITDELMKIIFTQGEILFVATIYYKNKGLPVTFKLIKNEEGKMTFENKDHDFPQQVMYYVRKSDLLEAGISGNTEQGFKKMDFSYYRMLR